MNDNINIDSTIAGSNNACSHEHPKKLMVFVGDLNK
jgi:hypothetical protein